ATAWPDGRWSTLAVAPDGAMWAVCASEPGAGQQPKELTVSTDGGKTWVSRGRLESGGYGLDVYPFSATMAWRTGARAELYRTTDGTHWQAVAQNPSGAYAGFVAIDADSAAYVDYGPADQPEAHVLYVTRDGGRTWTIR